MSAPTHEVVITILYKRAPDLTFDVAYFLNTHIPMAKKEWEKHGLLGGTIVEVSGESEYAYINEIRFKTLEGWQQAFSDQEKIGPLMADVSNFTNAKPDFVVGKVIEGGHIVM
ncbi:hypothetical protein GQ44DRAFT_718703 [Phaeosphaeriaceae sp. PMI808]|nr:hypothetical protein GQ44DRAFT_718703 [Phaeosphaeriaceae sp. PMI808]